MKYKLDDIVKLYICNSSLKKLKKGDIVKAHLSQTCDGILKCRCGISILEVKYTLRELIKSFKVGESRIDLCGFCSKEYIIDILQVENENEEMAMQKEVLMKALIAEGLM